MYWMFRLKRLGELHLVLEGWESAGKSRLIEIINRQLAGLEHFHSHRGTRDRMRHTLALTEATHSMDHKAATSINWFFQQAECDEKIHFQTRLNPSFCKLIRREKQTTTLIYTHLNSPTRWSEKHFKFRCTGWSETPSLADAQVEKRRRRDNKRGGLLSAGLHFPIH